MAHIVDAGTGGGGPDYPSNYSNTSNMLTNSLTPIDVSNWIATNVSVTAGKFFLATDASLIQVKSSVGYTPNALQFIAKYNFGALPSVLDTSVKALVGIDVTYSDTTVDAFVIPCIRQLVSDNGVYDINVMCELDTAKTISAISVRVNTLGITGGLYISNMVLQKISGLVDTTVLPTILYATVNEDLTYTFDGDSLPSTEEFERINYTPKEGDRVIVRKEGPKNIILGKEGDSAEDKTIKSVDITDGWLIITYTDGTSTQYALTKDSNGDLVAFTDGDNIILVNRPSGTDAPVLQSANVSSLGKAVVLNFSLVMAGSSGHQTEFVVEVDGVQTTISSTSQGATSKSLILNLSNTIVAGQVVTVSYAKGTYKSASGVALESFSDFTCTNLAPAAITVVSASTNEVGTAITVTFNTNIADPVGNTTKFDIKANGVSKGVRYMYQTTERNKLLLLPTTPCYAGEVLALNYTKGTVKSSLGLPLESFTNKSITNNVIVDAPVLLSAVASSDGSTVTVTFDKDMTNPAGKQSQFNISI
jgi:uncharacterized repeat protein (TIGR02059 family)